MPLGRAELRQNRAEHSAELNSAELNSAELNSAELAERLMPLCDAGGCPGGSRTYLP